MKCFQDDPEYREITRHWVACLRVKAALCSLLTPIDPCLCCSPSSFSCGCHFAFPTRDPGSTAHWIRLREDAVGEKAHSALLPVREIELQAYWTGPLCGQNRFRGFEQISDWVQSDGPGPDRARWISRCLIHQPQTPGCLCTRRSLPAPVNKASSSHHLRGYP